jgi:hypothetical protein
VLQLLSVSIRALNFLQQCLFIQWKPSYGTFNDKFTLVLLAPPKIPTIAYLSMNIQGELSNETKVPDELDKANTDTTARIIQLMEVQNN